MKRRTCDLSWIDDARFECWKKDIQLPGILTDEILAENGYAIIKQIQPEFDPVTQKIVARAPEKTEQGWILNYDVVALDSITISNNQNRKTVETIGNIRMQITQGDMNAVRFFMENDLAKFEEWKLKEIELKARIEELKATLPTSTS